MKKQNLFILLSLTLAMVTSCGKKDDSSGGEEDESVVKARFIDAPVQGVEYRNPDGNRDITLNDGSYYCKVGENTRFFIGGILLGEVECIENNKVYPMDLVSDGSTINQFDTSDQSTRVALLLLTLTVYNNQSVNKVENYTTSDRGPSSIVIGLSDRQMLQNYDNTIFTDDAKLLVLINKIRCFQEGTSTLADVKDVSVTDSVCGGSSSKLANLNASLQGAVYHMEKSVYDYSGEAPNSYIP